MKKSSNFNPKWLAIGIAAGVVVIGGAVIINNNLGNGSIDTADEVSGTIETDNGDLKINWDKYSTTTVSLDGAESYTITSSGIYHFTGSLTNGAIVVNAGKDAVVKIILDNVTIQNSSGPAIACLEAEDLVIELVGENTLEDGSSYSANYDEDTRGAIYSASDLTLQGTGTLNLTANLEDGIVSKDDLKFNSGTYNIVATDDGIRGKDSVYIVDGNFTIQSGGDAIKSTNETDAGKGFILIEKGTFAIKSVNKGVKAVNSILIYDGTFTVNSTDDSIHSNNYVGIIGGTFDLTSGDDGIHADRELIIDGGTVTIAKSYEGLEAQAITINGGTISVTASDDGLNAGGGADASATGRPGANAFDVDESCVLTINGGKLYVNASGDGLDSNGHLYINGGDVTVDGPTNNGNGALDAGAGIVQKGGTVVAVGASGMAETLGNSSSVNNVSIYFSSTLAAGTKVEIKNSADETIISHTSAKTFNHMAAGTSSFKSGETYTVYVNGSEYQSFTISSVTTVVGNSNQTFNNMQPGGQSQQSQQTQPNQAQNHR